MSEPPSEPSTEPAKKKKKMSEESILKEILKLQLELKNEHRTPSLFTFSSKYGHMQFGTTNVVDKFKDDFAITDEWGNAFDDDHEELSAGMQVTEEEDVDQYNLAKGNMPPKKLPADLDLMGYKELWDWITWEAIKEHWKKGGKLICVKWGHPDFEPSFWLGEIWPWQQVIKHPRDLAKSCYTGPGLMVNFLKKVIENCLVLSGITHQDHVDEYFTDKERKRRQRKRKKSIPQSDETEGESSAENVEGRREDNPNETIQDQTNYSDLSDLLRNNDVDLRTLNSSEIDVQSLPSATSTLTGPSMPTRRHSARQAAKRAREEARVSSISESDESCPAVDVPPLVSPIQSPPPPPQEQPGPSYRFVPRRKPIDRNNRGNFSGRLNVNVGQDTSRDGLKEIHLPSDLVDIFKTLSNHNTSLVLETGGIIAGIDMDTYYQVTHLLIPQQTAASDRWMVHDERQLTNYFVNNEDLIMLGLIHTHPNMTSFLSSVDLHALYDYAKDNHSLVSIVLAPERDTAPAYCLTSRGFK